MGSTSTERSRRLRRHRAGDHSLCLPERCDGATEAVASPVAAVASAVAPREAPSSPTSPKLGPRGRRLWEQLTTDGAALKPAERVLAEEACRTADRLDTLDRILRGDENAWMRFRSLNEDGTVVSVVINNVLAEARQQQVALKALLAELRTSQAGVPAKPGAGKQTAAPGTGGGGVAGVADIAARIAARRAQAAG